MKDSHIAAFWARVKKTDGCWVWSGGMSGCGYGQMPMKMRDRKAHRFSWRIHNGPIPRGLFVLHKCDNPPCVNPDHLFLGTNLDNAKDRAQKGRSAFGDRNGRHTHPEKVLRGEASPQSKLTANQVREIREKHQGRRFGYLETAKELGVTPQAIGFIVRGVNWKTA